MHRGLQFLIHSFGGLVGVAGDITVITSHGIGRLFAARCEPYGPSGVAHMANCAAHDQFLLISHMGHNRWTKLKIAVLLRTRLTYK